MNPEEVKKLIESGIEDAIVFVEGDGAHFEAIVVSDQFAGLTRIHKQQLVYNTVKEQLLDGTLHALTLQTFTQTEWQALQQSS